MLGQPNGSFGRHYHAAGGPFPRLLTTTGGSVRQHVVVILKIAIAGLLAAQMSGQEEAAVAPPRHSYAVEPVSVPPRIDGVMDDAAWESAARVELPWEWFPQVNDPAVVRTEMYVTFDETRLYVGFRAYDPAPASIRAHYADRDTAFLDDTVGLMIDTFNDQRRAFQFRVNPLGVQMEATNSDVDQSEDWSWDIIWDSEGRITAEGYEVEIAIPFNQLRFPRESGPQTWSILGMRDYPRNVRHRLRSAPLDQDRNCTVCQFEPMTGFRQIEAGRNLELVPTATATRSDHRPDLEGELQEGDFDFDAGLTTRWGITPNITLNATINPDFSQVEADAAQLDVNTTFALYYPEKRPFFLEGADFFGTRFNLVFTRTVADPIAGLKLTGKEGDHGFGVFATLDEVNNVILPGFERSRLVSLDQDVLASVVRYRRDVGARSSVGGIWAGREGEDGYANHVYGIDGVFQLTESDTIQYQVAGSSTEYPLSVAQAFGQPAGSFDGRAIGVEYRHSDRDWFWVAEYDDYSTDFRADSGFIPKVGYRGARVGVQRTFYGSSETWYRRLAVFAGADKTDQSDGQADEWGADLSLSYQGPLQSFLQVNLAPNREFYRGIHYDNFRQSIYSEFRPTGDLFVGMYAGWGETIDRSNARQGEFIVLEPSVEMKFGRHLEANVSHVYQTLDVAPGELFTVNLTQGRFIYHLNLRSFVRAIVQYENLDFNPSTWLFPVPDETEELFTQFLFSYKLNPQTVFLAGYSDGREGLDDVSLLQTDRSFFVKVGYAWLF